MDLAHPYRAVCPTVDGDVLRVLTGIKMALTGRQVALMTGRTSHSGVLASLNRLTEHGLVERVELNRAYLYSLNRDHLAARAVAILVEMREQLITGLREQLDTWSVPPVHAWLFGSAARGDGDTTSDIDLLVIRPNTVDEDELPWSQQIDDLRSWVARATGNHASIIELTELRLAGLLGAEAPIVSELQADAITLAGSHPSSLPQLA